MSWKARHAGSPKHASDLTLQQVMQGLVDGYWETSDEVMGPNESQWMPFESHPQFAEICDEMEPPPPRVHDDETKLDMNALIDVTLVLLIFFILLTLYAQLQTMVPAPSVQDKRDTKKLTKDKKVQLVIDKETEETTVFVRAELDEDNNVRVYVTPNWAPDPTSTGIEPIKLENPKRVVQEDLLGAFHDLGAGGRRYQMLLEHDSKIAHGNVIRIIDAARSAKIDKDHVYQSLITPPETPKPAG